MIEDLPNFRPTSLPELPKAEMAIRYYDKAGKARVKGGKLTILSGLVPPSVGPFETPHQSFAGANLFACLRVCQFVLSCFVNVLFWGSQWP